MSFLEMWGTKVHYNLLPEYNLPDNDMFFSEAYLGTHGCCKNNKENSERSDRENISYEKRETKITLSRTKKHILWKHQKYI